MLLTLHTITVIRSGNETDSEIGTIAVRGLQRYSRRGGTRWPMVTLLAPENASIDDIETIMKQLADSALSLNVDVIGAYGSNGRGQPFCHNGNRDRQNNGQKSIGNVGRKTGRRYYFN